MNKYDIAVIGGGMVGAAVAVGFAKQGRSVVVVEGAEPKAFDAAQALDVRVSAISHQSVKLLESLDAWSAIEAMRVCPYRRLETWEHPECRTRFHSDELSLDQLGYIVENRLIQLGLWQAFAQFDNLTVKCPERLKDIDFNDGNRITLESGEQFDANWIIGADGANSKVRQLAGIGVTAWDYRQHCMLINVKTELPQQDITWQQFTPSGPRSFLPLCSLTEDGQEVGQGSLVWYDSPKRIKQLCAMTKPQLREEIVRHFPKELGDIEVLQFGSFPLTRRHVQSYSHRGCVLVGDSAHTINPLAGQGVNLGFKDVDVLLSVTQGQDELTDALLAKYERTRRPDNLLMQTGMDFFYKGFSNDLGPVKFARNAALKLAENSGPIKAQVLKYALGM
ncbi:TPA: 2-octaprenyl-3-methyl-6-methoxy-1,4-benzoquinol hydroxylase [Vibrio parahaemolyticus]|uniref:2-octaprenyl-3-methyl-6-methoxy-1,4-benzoquinol hydroxylase n=1 Tax=Vibrio parahaemolyticus TaxID=670 RepID=UPI000419041D|nr:2-octaprenyl-3-methyl-6-methoxy-1,4-benzoquinol hydroxylase [Vibrio parahaemolyticus]MDF4765764.1 2-octaprenyl-3-methyl-6-methoxy-1,4-benzoquinol hydroxylase [Vibrio parahaemolyticus]HBC3406602.1 2-octaprenyl-3-methyl-6-methoxy-1,4-benzoquinol hydroxylase [Vibrio parahaemolyticus]HBH7869463.1 2-octaprenyl-3-methyl-6-methoxy-1,4-benzoquinol hydroxylase [Vibrio parahaemolyticus]HBN6094779.1 2-octaprenyl-3-methyl-6-methoxy-1,4-benzoquinol hydroxylase [Vibrio parahaemolyticus]HBN6096635.1 2-oct